MAERSLAERSLVERSLAEVSRQLDAKRPVLKAGTLIGAAPAEAAVARFSGHGGTYDVTYDWRVFA